MIKVFVLIGKGVNALIYLVGLFVISRSIVDYGYGSLRYSIDFSNFYDTEFHWLWNKSQGYMYKDFDFLHPVSKNSIIDPDGTRDSTIAIDGTEYLRTCPNYRIDNGRPLFDFNSDGRPICCSSGDEQFWVPAKREGGTVSFMCNFWPNTQIVTVDALKFDEAQEQLRIKDEQYE
ncbi:hypothetical protein LCS82_09010 [Vibrio harveyi]|uniref:hypothetical protein n=1 Tax=Vibrio harveyi TaxID=669 RepID=UPI003BB503F8